MTTQRLNSSIEYLLTDDNKAIQLILHPNAKIQIDQGSLLWFSEGVVVRDENNWIDRILKKVAIGTLSNVITSPVIVGLSQLENGPVLSIPLESGKKVFISKDCLLCSADNKINSSLLPLQFTINSLTISIMFLLKLPALLNSFYICEVS